MTSVSIAFYDGTSSTALRTVTLDETHPLCRPRTRLPVWQSLCVAAPFRDLRIVLSVTTAVPTGEQVVPLSILLLDTAQVTTMTYDGRGNLKTSPSAWETRRSTVTTA